jgi:hypothetical protein
MTASGEQVDKAATGEQAGKGGRGSLVVVAIVLLALVVAAAFYQEQLLNYWRLRGWDTGAVKGTMEQFVREAYDGQPSAGKLLDPAWIQPVIEDGKLVGVSQSGARGPTTTRLKDLLPAATVKECAVRIKNRSGVFQADVQFPNGQWGQFDVDRVKGALRIRSVPDSLSPSRPQPQPWD